MDLERAKPLTEELPQLPLPSNLFQCTQPHAYDGCLLCQTWCEWRISTECSMHDFRLSRRLNADANPVLQSKYCVKGEGATLPTFRRSFLPPPQRRSDYRMVSVPHNCNNRPLVKRWKQESPKRRQYSPHLHCAVNKCRISKRKYCSVQRAV